MLLRQRDILVMRFSVMNIAKQATAEKCNTNIRAEAEKYVV